MSSHAKLASSPAHIFIQLKFTFFLLIHCIDSIKAPHLIAVSRKYLSRFFVSQTHCCSKQCNRLKFVQISVETCSIVADTGGRVTKYFAITRWPVLLNTKPLQTVKLVHLKSSILVGQACNRPWPLVSTIVKTFKVHSVHSPYKEKRSN